MTRFSRIAVGLSLFYLLVGFTIGALMLASKAYAFYPSILLYLPLHIEYMMFGWFINLIFGVAYWMFPRFTPSRSTMDKPRGFVRAAWVSLLLLNTGLVIYTCGEFFRATNTVRLVGRLVELAAIACFMVNLWPRVKPMSQPG